MQDRVWRQYALCETLDHCAGEGEILQCGCVRVIVWCVRLGGSWGVPVGERNDEWGVRVRYLDVDAIAFFAGCAFGVCGCYLRDVALAGRHFGVEIGLAVGGWDWRGAKSRTI